MVGFSRLCTATRRDGSPCRGPALPSKPVCFAHDAERQEALRASRARGGRAKRLANRMDKLTPDSLRPVLSRLFTVLEELHTGEMEPQRATAMAAVASALVRAYGVGQLEARIERLEAANELRQRVAG